MDTPAPAPPQRRDYNVYVPEFNVCDKVRFVWQGDGPPAKYSITWKPVDGNTGVGVSLTGQSSTQWDTQFTQGMPATMWEFSVMQSAPYRLLGRWSHTLHPYGQYATCTPEQNAAEPIVWELPAFDRAGPPPGNPVTVYTTLERPGPTAVNPASDAPTANPTTDAGAAGAAPTSSSPPADSPTTQSEVASVQPSTSALDPSPAAGNTSATSGTLLPVTSPYNATALPTTGISPSMSVSNSTSSSTTAPNSNSNSDSTAVSTTDSINTDVPIASSPSVSETAAARKANTTTIVGAVVGGVVGLLLLAVLLTWWILRRRRQHREHMADSDSLSGGDMPLHRPKLYPAWPVWESEPQPEVTSEEHASDPWADEKRDHFAESEPPVRPQKYLHPSPTSQTPSSQTSSPLSLDTTTPSTVRTARHRPPPSPSEASVQHDTDAGRLKVLLPPMYNEQWKRDEDDDE